MRGNYSVALFKTLISSSSSSSESSSKSSPLSFAALSGSKDDPSSLFQRASEMTALYTFTGVTFPFGTWSAEFANNGGVRFVVVKYNGCASLAINQQMVKRKPFHWGRRREVFLSWIQWIMEKNSKRIVLYRIYMVLLSSLLLPNNLERKKSIWSRAGKCWSYLYWGQARRAITECNSSGNFNLGWKRNRHQC